MYTASPSHDDCSCGGPCCDEPLGAYSFGINSPFTPGPTGPPGAILPFVPGGVSTLPFDYTANRKWYDPIIDFVGDVGAEGLSVLKNWLERKIGRETWDRLPDASKEEAVRAAIEDLGSRAIPSSAAALPWLIGGAGILLFVALANRKGR